MPSVSAAGDIRLSVTLDLLRRGRSFHHFRGLNARRLRCPFGPDKGFRPFGACSSHGERNPPTSRPSHSSSATVPFLFRCLTSRPSGLHRTAMLGGPTFLSETTKTIEPWWFTVGRPPLRAHLWLRDNSIYRLPEKDISGTVVFQGVEHPSRCETTKENSSRALLGHHATAPRYPHYTSIVFIDCR